MVYSEAFIPC